VPFESYAPVRGFPSYKGQRHHAGRWWTATTGTPVGYESWLERDRVQRPVMPEISRVHTADSSSGQTQREKGRQRGRTCTQMIVRQVGT